MRLVFLEYVVNSSEQHSGNSNDCFLVSPTFLKSEIAVLYFGELLCTNGTLHHNRKHGHIHSNFRNDANSGEGLDTRYRHNKINLRRYFSAVDRIRDSRLSLHNARLSMWERMMRNFSACSSHISSSTKR